MKMRLHEIASLLGVAYSGEDFEIKGLNTLKDATQEQISFVANAKYIKDIATSQARAIIITSKMREYMPQGAIALEVDEPYWAMAILSKYFAPVIEDATLPYAKIGEGSVVSERAYLSSGVVIGKNVQIFANVYLGSNVTIGDDTIIYPNVTVYRDCHIGKRSILHAGSVIGGDGFGFATNRMGEHKKIYQNGNVVIEDDVEIGSCTTVDRAVFGTTRIKKGVRIDNLVQVGHNCEIGEYSVLVAQCGLAGSTRLGRNVVMGGQSAASGHLEIAPFTTFAARSGITKNIKESGLTFAGFPLMEHRLWLKLQGKIARLLDKKNKE